MKDDDQCRTGGANQRIEFIELVWNCDEIKWVMNHFDRGSSHSTEQRSLIGKTSFY
jgi:hypothetical protein